MAFEEDSTSKTYGKAGPRPDEGPMDDDELQTTIASILTDAEAFTDEELSPDRAKATDYYLGKPFGNEETGRSQVVLTDVRDGVQGALPSLLRVIFGPERVVEFAPTKPESADAAEQATDYVEAVITQDNPGFLRTLEVLKDGLVRRIGVFKWGWDDTSSVKTYSLENVGEDQLVALAQETGVELTRIEPKPATGENQPPLYDVELTREDPDGRARVWSVPPEEFIYSREARDVETALFVGHRTEKTRGELIAMGIDAEVIDEHGGTSSRLSDNEEALARNERQAGGTDPEAGEANDKIIYIEGFPRIDYDGDGVAELRRVCTIGPGYYVVDNEPVASRPFSVFVPLPEPHTLGGQSWADLLMDVQRTKSSVVRAMLDSLAQSIFPRTAIVEGQVNIQDVLNTEIGAPIRQKAPGMVTPFEHPFTGEKAFPVLQYFDDISERRTSQSKGAIGLDLDALQSTEKDAANVAVTSAQAQIELLARIFTETAFKPLFRGLLELLIAHQPRARTVRLRGKWVEVDPRLWDADMDVMVNVALGSGLMEQKVAILGAVAAKQELVFSTLGPQNPLVSLAQYSNTLRKALSLQGWKNVDEFFSSVPPDWQPPQPPQPPPDPNMMLVQVEAQKAQAAAQAKQQELQLKVQELQARLGAESQQNVEKLAIDRARLEADVQRMAAEIELKRIELELKYSAQIDATRINAAAQQARVEAESDLRDRELSLEHDRELAAMQLEHERESRALEQQATQQAGSDSGE